MSAEVARGRLREPSAAPARSEEFFELVRCRNLVVEQILSGELDEPLEYLQEQDELVLLLAGGAELSVGGETLKLEPGDWVFLPARVPHSVRRTEPETSWLAVHLHPGPGRTGPGSSD
jgi:cupin 2 domain-containing protein